MYGWRARIGLINVANNTVLEPEFQRLMPAGVQAYCTRITFRPTIEGLRDMVREVDHAAQLLASEGMSDLIVFGCTMGSMIQGPGYDQEIVARIERASGTKAIAITTAVRAAFGALGLRRLAVATPYTRDICDVEEKVLTECGYTVTRLASVFAHVEPKDFTNDMIGRLWPADAYRLARQIDSPEAEGVFISCANFHCLDIIAPLEADLGKPVVTSNQATAWFALRTLGIREAIPGFGRLLTDH